MGRFNMGSTVILVLPPGTTAWHTELQRRQRHPHGPAAGAHRACKRCVTSSDWQPDGNARAVCERRAAALAQVRAFFAKRGVMEVDTPVVVNAPVTDVHIHSAEVRFPDDAGGARSSCTPRPSSR